MIQDEKTRQKGDEMAHGILQVRNKQLTEVLGYLQTFTDDYHSISEGSQNYRSLVIAYSCLFQELIEEFSLTTQGEKK